LTLKFVLQAFGISAQEYYHASICKLEKKWYYYFTMTFKFLLKIY
jgi:hypothetical protein